MSVLEAERAAEGLPAPRAGRTVTAAKDTNRTSMLAKLTADVMGEKVKSSKALTPVAGEATPTTYVLPKARVPFPNDHPQEVIEQKASELTRIIDHLIEARDALLTVVEMPVPAEVVDIEAIRKQKEAEADERVAEAEEQGDDFNARFAAMQAEAQAAVFGKVEVEPSGASVALAEDMGADVPEEWFCPDHGKAVVKQGKKGPYRGCPDCNKFER